jgi:hypothetical protein
MNGGLSVAVDTKKAERRSVRFASIADARRDLDALEAAQKAGTLRTTGNWTPGEILTHLAAWVNYGFDGFPPELNPPFFVRWLGPMMRGRMLRKGLPRGFRIPKIPRGTTGMEDVPVDEGLRRLRAAYDRLEKSEPPVESPALGKMSYPEKIQMQLRHAELHLGFLHSR